MTASTGDRSAVANPEDPAAEVYEWTVLKRWEAPAGGGDAADPRVRGRVCWDQVGIVGSDSNYFLYSDETAKIGALAGAGEYLCVHESRAVRMTLVAETVYRKKPEREQDSSDTTAGAVVSGESVQP